MRRVVAKLLKRIESLEFQIPFGVHSGLEDFIEAIEASPDFRELTVALAKSDNAMAIRDRAKRIIRDTEFDVSRSTKDTALAVYFLALSAANTVVIDLLDESHQAKHALWWAARVAGRVALKHSLAFQFVVVRNEPDSEFDVRPPTQIVRLNPNRAVRISPKRRSARAAHSHGEVISFSNFRALRSSGITPVSEPQQPLEVRVVG